MQPTKLRKHRRRRGAAMTEAAMVLPVCALLLVSMLDASLLVIRHTSVSAIAREIAREAVVHGFKAAPFQGSWGPNPVTTTAAGNHPVAAAAAGMVLAMNTSQVAINVTWPDGDNAPGSRVRVSVSHTHVPLVGLASWYGGINLVGTSTMTIAH